MKPRRRNADRSAAAPPRVVAADWTAIAMRVLIGLAVGPLTLTGCHTAEPVAASSESAEAEVTVRVKLGKIEKTTLTDTLELMGTTQPLRQRTARVTTAVEGQVAALLPNDSAGQPLREGSVVEQGQIIGHLENSLAKATLAKAQGTLAEAKAALLVLQNTPRQQQLQAAKGLVKSAKSAAKAAESQVERLVALANLVAPGQLADARTAAERANSDLHSAEAKLDELTKEPVVQKIAELEAKVLAATADVDAAKAQLARYEFRSPIAGRLGQLSVYLGQSLALGAPICTVTDLSQIEVQILAPARSIARLHLDQPATIVWGEPPQKLTGKVTFVDVQSEPGSACYVVRVQCDNPDEALRSGIVVRARIDVNSAAGVLAVPRAAVIEENDIAAIFVVDQQKHTARRVIVTTGIRTRDQIEISGDDLHDGLPVVVEGNYYLPEEGEIKIDAGEEDETEKPGEHAKQQATGKEKSDGPAKDVHPPAETPASSKR